MLEVSSSVFCLSASPLASLQLLQPPVCFQLPPPCCFCFGLPSIWLSYQGNGVLLAFVSYLVPLIPFDFLASCLYMYSVHLLRWCWTRIFEVLSWGIGIGKGPLYVKGLWKCEKSRHKNSEKLRCGLPIRCRLLPGIRLLIQILLRNEFLCW